MSPARGAGSLCTRRVCRAIAAVVLAAGAYVVAGTSALHAQPSRAADSSASERVVRAFIAAYNRHDVPALLALADTGITWLSVEGDSVRVETRGREALGRSLEAYFRQLPSARSTLESVTALGAWVSAREWAEWQGANGPRRQAALSVYEVRDGLVRRVWYYPLVR